MKVRVLDAYEMMSNNAIITLNTVPFALVQGFRLAAVSKRRFVLQSRRDSAARADLSVTECTKPIDSVQIVTMRFIMKLRISLLVAVGDGKKATTPAKLTCIPRKDVLRQDGGMATSSSVCRYWEIYIPSEMQIMLNRMDKKTPVKAIKPECPSCGYTLKGSISR